jgi:hypothetical protein
MPKHYANKRLTRLDSIFDEINTEDDHKDTNNSTGSKANRESTSTDSPSIQAKEDVQD